MLSPKFLLRLEGAAALISACIFYRQLHADWLLFFLLILAPDLCMLGYLVNKKLGAAVYNLVHTYTFPLVLIIVGSFTGRTLCSAISLIWLAHIAMDRMLGFGLKYESAFQDTHLQRV